MKINPDFRTVDEVELPSNWRDLQGWTDGTETEREAVDREKRAFDVLEADMPVAFKSRAPVQIEPTMLKAWNEFQQSKGRYPGSNDMTLLDQFIAKKDLAWKPQIIGSCVISNTFPAWVARLMYQIVIEGQSYEYLGRDEFGPLNFAPYAPWSYGMARRRANMRRGDGLYCEPMAESLMKDGILPCSAPKLIELAERLGVGRDTDYPEPQSAKVYREFGSWSYLDELKPYADFNVLDITMVKSAEQLWQMGEEGKTCFVCSMEAIKKVGEHPDGFPIHARDPRNTWAHNMAWHGNLVASDGERFFRESNTSWGGQHIYTRRYGEVDRAIGGGGLTIAAIGQINAPRSSAPLAA